MRARSCAAILPRLDNIIVRPPPTRSFFPPCVSSGNWIAAQPSEKRNKKEKKGDGGEERRIRGDRRIVSYENTKRGSNFRKDKPRAFYITAEVISNESVPGEQGGGDKGGRRGERGWRRVPRARGWLTVKTCGAVGVGERAKPGDGKTEVTSGKFICGTKIFFLL